MRWYNRNCLVSNSCELRCAKDNLIRWNILKIENHSDYSQLQWKAKQQMHHLCWSGTSARHISKVAFSFFCSNSFNWGPGGFRPTQIILFSLQWRQIVESPFLVSCAYFCRRTSVQLDGHEVGAVVFPSQIQSTDRQALQDTCDILGFLRCRTRYSWVTSVLYDVGDVIRCHLQVAPNSIGSIGSIG